MTRPLVLTLLVAACGPASPGATDSAPASTSTTGDPGTTTTTPPATTSTADTGDVPTSPLSSDTTPPTTTADTTGETTTAATTTTTGETTTATTTATTETTTGATDDEYVAFFFAGGLDHILIHKADAIHDRCTTVHLARPTNGDPNLAITVPEMWGPVDAGIAMGLDGCLDGMPGDFGVAASKGAGVITWQLDPMQLCPKLISLNLDLEFPQDMPWVPAKDHLETMDLVVQNCP